MRKMTKRSAIVAAGSVAAIGVASIAFAAWTADGEGTAAATAGTSAAVQVSAGTVVDELVPGTTSNLAFTVTNPNDFPVTISSVTLADIDADGFSVLATGGLNNAACQGDAATNGPTGVTGIVFTGPAGDPNTKALDSAITIAAGDDAEVTVTGAVKMTNDSDNGCQGASFALDLKVPAVSAAS